MSARLLAGDCRDRMAELPECSVDAIVSDPPYGLGFMGKGWDHQVPGVDFWLAAMRVAKPGAHLIAFGGTRTFHRLACAIEDAGWELRDTLGWLYGSGFPKSLDVAKAIDKAAGAEREVLRPRLYDLTDGGGYSGKLNTSKPRSSSSEITAPATESARQWHGWGTALKPAWEPVILARKPLAGTVAANVLSHGTGALNIDGCRIGGGEERQHPTSVRNAEAEAARNCYGAGLQGSVAATTTAGRWPANILHDGTDEVLAVFPSGAGGGFGKRGGNRRDDADFGFGATMEAVGYGDTGSAARFFWSPKTSTAERNIGMPPGRTNTHPTVKPVELMAYLCRLVCPPGGTILDPFMGSGSTGIAALREGFGFIGIDLDPAHVEIARLRITGDSPLLAKVSNA